MCNRAERSLKVSEFQSCKGRSGEYGLCHLGTLSLWNLFALACVRVGLLVGLFEALRADVRVDLRGR